MTMHGWNAHKMAFEHLFIKMPRELCINRIRLSNASFPNGKHGQYSAAVEICIR